MPTGLAPLTAMVFFHLLCAALLTHMAASSGSDDSALQPVHFIAGTWDIVPTHSDTPLDFQATNMTVMLAGDGSSAWASIASSQLEFQAEDDGDIVLTLRGPSKAAWWPCTPAARSSSDSPRGSVSVELGAVRAVKPAPDSALLVLRGPMDASCGAGTWLLTLAPNSTSTHAVDAWTLTGVPADVQAPLFMLGATRQEDSRSWFARHSWLAIGLMVVANIAVRVFMGGRRRAAATRRAAAAAGKASKAAASKAAAVGKAKTA